MTESNLSELLEHAARRTPVSPPPIEVMLHQAARRRRRIALVASALSTAAVVTAIAGAALVTQQPDTTTPAGEPTLTEEPVPDGMRLVGLGNVTVAVPEEWATNALHCGTPQEDTVIVDPGAMLACGAPRPDGVESVKVARGALDMRVDETFEISGVQASRQHTTCESDPFGDGELCTGLLYLETGVWVEVESSTSAKEVDRILDRVQVVPDLVGVPEYLALKSDARGSAGEKYVDLLHAAGLKAVLESRSATGPNPYGILEVTPGPGTMLTPGDTVTVVIAESGSTSEPQNRTPATAPGLQPGERYATSNYPRNKQGLTYGSAALASTYEEQPDLIAVVGLHGREGFLRKRDAIQHRKFATGDEAVAWSQEVRRNPPAPVPVYDLDGVTEIDTWRYGIAGLKVENRDGTLRHLPEGITD